MRLRPFLSLLLIAVGLFALFRLQWQHQLGGLASSPQEIYVDLGRAKIVGGGMALLRFHAWDGERANLEVRCAAEREVYDLRTDDTTGAVCGLQVRLMLIFEASAEDPLKAWFDVYWPASSDSTTHNVSTLE